MKKFLAVIILFGAFGSAGHAWDEKTLSQFERETFGNVVEIQNIPTESKLAQGRNFKGGPLLEFGFYTWCQVNELPGTNDIAPGDKYIVFRTSAGLSNGVINHDREGGFIDFLSVPKDFDPKGKLLTIDIYCEPGAGQHITESQMKITLNNYFKFTDEPLSPVERDALIGRLRPYFSPSPDITDFIQKLQSR